MKFIVALCGLTDHKAHLIRLVVSAAPASRYEFHIGTLDALAWADVAVVETQSKAADGLLAGLRRINPAIVPIYISDRGDEGDSVYRIGRTSLLLQIHRLLERAVEEAILGIKTARPVAAREASPRVFGRATPRHDTTLVDGRVPDHFGTPMALVVDDSATVRAQTRAMLQRVGIESREAEDAEQALRMLSTMRFDLALLDVMMPGTDGYELCRRVKRDPRTREMPVLMLTSRSSPFDRARGALVGCDSYLVKPVEWNNFAQAIEKVLARIAQRERNAMPLGRFLGSA